MADSASTEHPRGGRRLALGCAAATLAVAALVAILVVVSNVVAKPLGTVAAFAVGAFVVASRAELSAALLESYGVAPGASTARLHELWLAALGVLVAAAVPLLVVAL